MSEVLVLTYSFYIGTYHLDKGSFCQTIHNSSSCVKRYSKNPSRQTPAHAHKQTNKLNQTSAKTGATVHISTVPAQANVAVSELKPICAQILSSLLACSEYI